VSVTEDARPAAPPALPGPIPATGPGRHVSPWHRLVAASALLLLGAVATLAVWWAVTHETRITSYTVVGQLAGIDLDLGAADVELAGSGAQAVELRRLERFSFGRGVRETRSVIGRRLVIRSRCADDVLGGCHVVYRITVPENVPVDLTTGSGSVRLGSLRSSAVVTTGSGAITADAFCGYSLRALSDSGAVRALAECSPDRLELRSGSGNVSAVVPPGRYRVDAQSVSGRRRVRGLTVADDAPFQVQALSTSGDVAVEGGA
jgi:hypothetical protein